MKEDLFTFLVAGKAGEGIRRAGTVALRIFSWMGREAFQMDDYQSLIRGGHNFSIVSTSLRKVLSHYMKADLAVIMDERSFKLHRNHLSDSGTIVFNSDRVHVEGGTGIPFSTIARRYSKPDLILGVGAVAVLCAATGVSEKELSMLIEKNYPKGVEENLAYSREIYSLSRRSIGNMYPLKRREKEAKPDLTGNEAIALGGAAAGLDIYIAYPMTPSSSILHYLAAHGEELGVITVHPENEIAVANIALGAAAVGARTMVGSSGGGLALMEEAFSLAGMAEVPLLAILSSRPGPSTGVPTYTQQADLLFAIHQGHGDFPKIVASPGSVEEAFYLTAEMLDLVWRFQTLGILLTEKHLSESRMTVYVDPEKASWPEPKMSQEKEYKRYRITEDGISPLLFPPSEDIIKWNSYEHDEAGITTEDPQEITAMREKRLRKAKSLERQLKEMTTVRRFGKGRTRIFTYGSTTMSVLEAVDAGGLEAEVVQIVYLEPFPRWEVDGERGIVVEQSSSGQFARLLTERGGVKVEGIVKRYDGRPFDPLELAENLREVL